MHKMIIKREVTRKRRTMRVRKNVRGTTLKPRLCVVKTNCHIQAQLIDDSLGKTVGSIATTAKEFRDSEFGRKNKAAARKLGERIAEIAKDLNIREVVFDRGQFKYHGILAELANAARTGGLQF